MSAAPSSSTSIPSTMPFSQQAANASTTTTNTTMSTDTGSSTISKLGQPHYRAPDWAAMGVAHLAKGPTGMANVVAATMNSTSDASEPSVESAQRWAQRQPQKLFITTHAMKSIPGYGQHN